MKSHKTIKVGQTCRACGNIIKEGSKHFDMTGEACWTWREGGGHVCSSHESVDIDQVGIHDCIYDNQAWDDIKARFPQATKQDASDDFHEDRIGVDIPEVSKRDWYQFLLKSGWAGMSLWFGLDVRMGGQIFPAPMLRVDGQAHPANARDGDGQVKRIRQYVVVPQPAYRRWIVARRDEGGGFLFEGHDAEGWTIWVDDFHKAIFHSEPPHPDDLMRLRIFGRPQLPRDAPLLLIEVDRFIQDSAWIVEPDEFKGEGI